MLIITIPFLVTILAAIILIIYLKYKSKSSPEGFTDLAGHFCGSCNNLTYNQCLNCANCGFLVDQFGNSGCIGGDHKGPYNYEKGKYWYYYGSPWTQMLQDQMSDTDSGHYKCSYGPSQANRRIMDDTMIL